MIPAYKFLNLWESLWELCGAVGRNTQKIRPKYCQIMVSQAGVEPATYRLGGG
jgi:hypothetical protein